MNMRTILSGIKIFIVILFPLFFLSPIDKVRADESSVEIRIKGVSCPFCIYGIEKKLKQIPGIKSVKTNYKESTVSLVRKKGSSIDIRALYNAIKDAGFSVDSIRLRLQGVLTNWEGKPALKEDDSHQLFLLIEPGKEEPHPFLSEKKFTELKKLAGEGQHLIWIRGEAHHHDGIPLAITVLTYGKL